MLRHGFIASLFIITNLWFCPILCHASGWSPWYKLDDGGLNGIEFSHKNDCPPGGRTVCTHWWRFNNGYETPMEIEYTVAWDAGFGIRSKSGQATIRPGVSESPDYTVSGVALDEVSVRIIADRKLLQTARNEVETERKKREDEERRRIEAERKAEEARKAEAARLARLAGLAALPFKAGEASKVTGYRNKLAAEKRARELEELRAQERELEQQAESRRLEHERQLAEEQRREEAEETRRAKMAKQRREAEEERRDREDQRERERENREREQAAREEEREQRAEEAKREEKRKDTARREQERLETKRQQEKNRKERERVALERSAAEERERRAEEARREEERKEAVRREEARKEQAEQERKRIEAETCHDRTYLVSSSSKRSSSNCTGKDTTFLAFLTNNSSEKVYCSIKFYSYGTPTGDAPGTGLAPGQTVGGSSGGLWACNADSFRYKCALPGDNYKCTEF